VNKDPFKLFSLPVTAMDNMSLSDSQKLDFLINSMTEVQKNQASLVQLVSRVTALETRVTEQDKTIASLQAEIKTLKDRDNNREQQSRGNALRIYNFPGSGDEVNLAAKVYEKLLKPILAAAKAKGELPTLPQVGNTIEDVYRTGKFAAGQNKPPPPIVVKFSSPAVRLAVLRNKRNNTPPPGENQKKMSISEDLTPATHRKLKDLLADERVAKVWTLNGSLRYVTHSENSKPMMVKSVFDSNDKILS